MSTRGRLVFIFHFRCKKSGTTVLNNLRKCALQTKLPVVRQVVYCVAVRKECFSTSPIRMRSHEIGLLALDHVSSLPSLGELTDTQKKVPHSHKTTSSKGFQIFASVIVDKLNRVCLLNFKRLLEKSFPRAWKTSRGRSIHYPGQQKMDDVKSQCTFCEHASKFMRSRSRPCANRFHRRRFCCEQSAV